MHNAPSVSYPVGRCAFQGLVFVVLCMASGAFLVAWAWVQPMGWIWGLAVGCWLLATWWACLLAPPRHVDLDGTSVVSAWTV